MSRADGAARPAPSRHDTARRAAAVPAGMAPTWAAPIVAAADYRTPVTTTTTSTTTTTVAPHPVVAARSTPVTTPPRATTTTTAPPAPKPAGSGNEETGEASWYQAPAGTCASPDLAFGTTVTVTDLSTGDSVTCTVDDRQARSPGRVIDLAEATFAKLADPSTGLIEVRLTW
ncbi:MAG TPA: septal ring lytic transglycosylase RlpA family protein [Acidimicrobiales bacterium]|nr:septal ring lytic transglycosylase RlpA family protein [Acidimicrobiales bacterium]